MGAGGAKSFPAQGLRLLEHGARAFEVIGGDHDLHAPERGVGKIDVDVSVGELPGQLAERHGPVLDLDYQDLTLISDPYSGALKGRPAAGHGIVVQEHVDNTPALTREGRKATDADTSFASDLPQPGQLTRPVLENHRQIRGHRILILPPHPAPGQSGRTGPAGPTTTDVLYAPATTLLAAGRAHPSGLCPPGGAAGAGLPQPAGSAEPLAHAAGSCYLPVALLTARAAESMICSSRLLWAPRQYTWPQLWQRENAW